jgi:predicted SnoaL-like aldol condensation-catalyzing enzyme
MTNNGNKAIVSRFIKEVLGGGNTDLIDELLAPDYTNPSMGVTNRTGFKAVISGLKALPQRDFEIADLIAEGDSVVFRGNMNVTLASGKRSPPGLSHITVLLTGRS